MKELKETHMTGIISIENAEILNLYKTDGTQYIEGDLGIKISADGRIWVCINGIAFIRFKSTELLKSYIYKDIENELS